MEGLPRPIVKPLVPSGILGPGGGLLTPLLEPGGTCPWPGNRQCNS